MAAAACTSGNPNDRITGQTEFISAPMAGTSAGGARNGGGDGTAAGGAGGSAGTPATSPGNTGVTRTVEETDLYRLEGTRLYYLNGYRGLMVFDVSDVDHPKLLGRSAIYGSPVEMLVRNGVAIVVVADWYGQMDDGTPFHGSIVRGLDATDPANIKVLGEAKLGGWVRDTRVVGDVLYAVSEDYGWSYGWGVDAASTGSAGSGTVSPGQTTETVIVSSVSFASNYITAVGKQVFSGYSGIFNVTPNSILLAHDPGTQTAQTELLYLDISDAGGAIVKRGAITVDGRAQGWGADNGRWNLDFADGKTAHVIGCGGGQYGCDGSGYLLDTVDFSNPDAPVLKSKLAIPSTGWSVAARFDTNRLYLSPDNYSTNGNGTPLQVYDTTDPTAPKLAGSTTIPGTVWNILPAPQSRIFALGNDWSNQSSGDSVSLKYLDVSNPTAPTLLGTSTFGQGWAWTPAAGTFKAFTMDATKGLVVLPFSGWSYDAQTYNNGLQLIEFTPTSERTAGASHTKGWVERGIFVGNRLVSLSDLALSVVDYTNHDAPVVTAELTLARNVIAAQPGGATIAEISSDW
ncbi:MAG TPA: beta-propeller domain-containing protein, partial [Polyangia bacterium]